MAQISLEDLVNENRFQEENLLGLILYFPVGAFLIVIRLIVGIFVWLVSAVVPEISSIRLYITNFTCFTLGVHVKSVGQRDDKARLIVSNAVSIFDPLALHVSSCTIMPSKWDLPPPLAWALGIRHLGLPASNEQFREAVKKKFADIPSIPIAAQPEGCPTSGKGILKFSKWPFMLYDKVQPAAIEVKRCFGNVTTASVNHWSSESFPWGDLFWFLWNPYTVFTVNLLPTMERTEQESVEEFAGRVQRTISESLQVEATQFTSTELRVLVAQREAERDAVSSGPGAGRDGSQPGPSRPDLRRMAAQVKEVLPSVPLAVIMKDLGRTRSVDVTLSNILEGTVPYTPEEETNPLPPPASSPPAPTNPPPPLSTAAATFQKTAQGRQLSFQERKAQLIQEARKRYCEKHGLAHLL